MGIRATAGKMYKRRIVPLLVRGELSPAPPADTFLNIAALDADKDEGAEGEVTDFTFTVTRSGDTSGTTTVNYTTAGTTNTLPTPAVATDFVGDVFPSGVVTFNATETSQVITTQVKGNNVVDGDREFTVTLSSPSGGAIIQNGSAQGFIRDDDVAVDTFLNIIASRADKPEGASTTTTDFVFKVKRTGTITGVTTVNYAVTGTTTTLPDAAVAADFGGSFPSGTVTFNAQETDKYIPISVSGNDTDENDREFTVTLSGASTGTTIETATALGFIRDDDGAWLSDLQFKDVGGDYFELGMTNTVLGINGLFSTSYAQHDLAQVNLTSVTTVTVGGGTYSVPGGAEAEVPHSFQIEARVTAGSGGEMDFGGTQIPITETGWTTYNGVGTATSIGEQIKVAANSGATLEVRGERLCEGQVIFLPAKSGSAVYGARVKKGLGLDQIEAVTNKCTNFNVAPTATTNVTDSGTTTTVVARADLPSALITALDSEDPDKTIRAMYRSQGTGTVFVTGQTGNTNTHQVQALAWAETGTAGAVIGLEGSSIDSISAVETLEWIGGGGTPAANTDRWSLAVVTGDVYWIFNQLSQNDRRKAIVPIAGASRTRGQDIVRIATSDLGITTGMWTTGVTVNSTADFIDPQGGSNKHYRFYSGSNKWVELQGQTGANVSKYLGTIVNPPASNTFTVRTSDTSGVNTLRFEFAEGYQELFKNGTSTGSPRTASMPTDMDTLVLGTSPGGGNRWNGYFERFTVYDGTGVIT